MIPRSRPAAGDAAAAGSGAAGDAVLLIDGGGVVVAGHVAAGGGPAQVAVVRTGGLALFGGGAGSPSAWWRSAALDAAGPRHDVAGCATAAGVHHGVNREGLLVACAAGGPVARAGLAGAVLGRAGGVEEAAALLASAAALDGPDRVWLAGAGGGLLVELDGGSARCRPVPLEPGAGSGLGSVRAALRRDTGPGAVSAIAARLEPGGASLLVCLGPPAAGIFIRQWPGIPAPPSLTAAGDRAPRLGSLAARLAAARPSGADVERLAAAEAEALAEGEDAERLARLMDAAGDDHGAEVRRALAQAHAADLAATALERLLACPGPVPGPTL